jgi:MFS family permease
MIAAGMAMLGAGFILVALTASVDPEYTTLVLALVIAGVGVSMTLPTVPTAVLGAVDAAELGAASGTNNMLQRFGAVFGVALATSVFSANGKLGTPASFTDGYKPAIALAAALALLGALAGVAVTTPDEHRIDAVEAIAS